MTIDLPIEKPGFLKKPGFWTASVLLMNSGHYHILPTSAMRARDNFSPMTANFTGSQSLDERRRRWLVSVNDEVHLNSESAFPSTDTGDTHDSSAVDGIRGSQPEAEAVVRFPISRLISRKLWKHLAVGLLGLLIGAGIVYAGWVASSEPKRLGPGFVHLFDLSTGGAARQFCGWLLFLSSQLALLICWVRARSPRDFAGRYRWWAWCAMIGFAAAVTTSNKLHIVWSQTALWQWKLDFWNAGILIWLLPVSAAAIWLLFTLHREMRDCSSSPTMLWTAAGCGLLAALLTLRAVHFPVSAQELQLIHTGVELAAHWALFVSLLLHARHVVHVTADAAEIRQFPFNLRSLLFNLRSLLFNLRSLLRWPEFRQPTRTGQQTPSVTDKPIDDKPIDDKPIDDKPIDDKPIKALNPVVAKISPAKRKQNLAPVKVESTSSLPDNQSENVPVPQAETTETLAGISEPAVESDDESDDAVESDMATAQDNTPEPMLLSEPLDKDSLKGLSKRERRRLRKQHHEAQRASRSERRAG